MVARLELERRVMVAALVATCVSAVIWLIAISTNEWCSVTFDEWRYINSSRTYIKVYNIGLWKMCAHLFKNATSPARGPSRLRAACFLIVASASTEESAARNCF